MKSLVLIVVIFSCVLFFNGLSMADDISDLREEIQKLRRD